MLIAVSGSVSDEVSGFGVPVPQPPSRPTGFALQDRQVLAHSFGAVPGISAEDGRPGREDCFKRQPESEAVEAAGRRSRARLDRFR